MENLPSELLGKIFEFLPNNDKLNCLLVCRLWHRVGIDYSVFCGGIVSRRYVIESARSCQITVSDDILAERKLKRIGFYGVVYSTKIQEILHRHRNWLEFIFLDYSQCEDFLREIDRIKFRRPIMVSVCNHGIAREERQKFQDRLRYVPVSKNTIQFECAALYAIDFGLLRKFEHVIFKYVFGSCLEGVCESVRHLSISNMPMEDYSRNFPNVKILDVENCSIGGSSTNYEDFRHLETLNIKKLAGELVISSKSVRHFSCANSNIQFMSFDSLISFGVSPWNDCTGAILSVLAANRKSLEYINVDCKPSLVMHVQPQPSNKKSLKRSWS